MTAGVQNRAGQPSSVLGCSSRIEIDLFSGSEAPVVLWILRPTRIDDATYAGCLDDLDDAERARHDRFRFAHLRRDYAVAHALVRHALSAHAGTVEPAAWELGYDDNGRPGVEGPAGPAPMFSLSHTNGCVVVGVCDDLDLGVDVERVSDNRELLALAGRYFAPAEVATLQTLTADEQPGRFFDLWTLKESYVKARGMGLSLPLDRFVFTLGGPTTTRFEGEPVVSPRPITIELDRIDDDAARWEFRQIELGGEYRAAVAARRSKR